MGFLMENIYAIRFPNWDVNHLLVAGIHGHNSALTIVRVSHPMLPERELSFFIRMGNDFADYESPGLKSYSPKHKS
jgi:hypothetical protein